MMVNKEKSLLNMIIIHFSISDTLTADDLQEYMDSAFGSEQE
jgi:hypothetical protein